MIPEAYDRHPIGRQLHRMTRAGVREDGLVQELISIVAGPKPTRTYKVIWTSGEEPSDTYDDILDLRSLFAYYSDEDTYVDEPFVDAKTRVLQKVGWVDRKVPKEGSAEWCTLLNIPFKSSGKAGKAAGSAPRPAAAKTGAAPAAELASPASAAPSAPAQEAQQEAGRSEQRETRKRKSTSLASPVSKAAGLLQPLKGLFGKASNAADAIKEAPQALGQKISDALPGSSHKLSSTPAAGEATASKANSTKGGASEAGTSQATSKAGDALASGTSPKQEAQKKDTALLLADIVNPTRKGSGAKTKASGASKARPTSRKSYAGSASKPRVSKASLRKAAQAEPMNVGDTELEVDVLDEEDLAPEQEGAERGEDDAGSPNQQQAAGPSGAEGDEMVALPPGACQSHIPRRVMFDEGDVPVAEHTAPGYVEENAEYVVDSIVAERKQGNSFEYLVKWKGYELDINQWEPRDALEELEAMDHWERLNGKSPKKKMTRKKAKR